VGRVRQASGHDVAAKALAEFGTLVAHLDSGGRDRQEVIGRISDEMVDALTIAGTDQDCQAGLEALLRAVLCILDLGSSLRISTMCSALKGSSVRQGEPQRRTDAGELGGEPPLIFRTKAQMVYEQLRD
jgi:hypothetical protein